MELQSIKQTPDTVRYRKFVTELQRAVNDASLPAFAMIPVVRELLAQLVRMDERQYTEDVNQMEESAKKEVVKDANQRP